MKRHWILGLAIATIVAGAGVVSHRDGARAAASGSLLYSLTTPNPQTYATFGQAVAAGDVNGDGEADIIVGAVENIGGNVHQGRVYVFSGADGSLFFTMDTPSPQADAHFGSSVATGDVNADGKADIIVGAWGENVGGNAYQGRAYVFSGADGSMIYALTTPNPQVDAYFGESLSAGDVNGDGRADLVVGARSETSGGNAHQGRVYVFSGTDGSLLYTLDTANPQPFGGFGYSVAAGDVNNDGKADLAVGAYIETVGGNIQQGRVYVFSGADGSLLYELTTPYPQTQDWYGISVATGDVDNDGNRDVVVGALGETVDGKTHQGRAYVYSGADGSLLRAFNTPKPQPWARFGAALAASDVDGDGKADVIAGAPGETIGNWSQGRTYVLSATDGSLLLALTTPNPGQYSSRFGGAVAAGDIDADGKADPIIGAVGEAISGNAQQGRTYVFAGGAAIDTDGDGCTDPWESLLVPPTDPSNPWDFYSVPVPALRLDSAGVLDDSIGVTTDIVALLAYTGLTPADADYAADRDANGIADGLQYDRSVSGTPGIAGPPDGGIGITTDVMVMVDQIGYVCGP